MAGDYLRSQGIDIETYMSNIQSGTTGEIIAQDAHRHAISKIVNARLPGKDPSTLWTLAISDGTIASIEEQSTPGLNITHLPGVLDVQRKVCVPSLCHAHIHLDKCFILEDEKFSDLEIVEGDFNEAMALTGDAKKRFDEDDLLRRGRRLIEESVQSGVTAMRAFVEVDEIVQLKAVKAGLKLKDEYRATCYVQICAFAQLALFTGEDGGRYRRHLMEEALALEGVEVVGSTPYVEADRSKMVQNVDWTISQALANRKHLDFHLDYFLDIDLEPLIYTVLRALRDQLWNKTSQSGRTICLGHCTRLTRFTRQEWNKLKEEIGDLPIHFIGLPKSDLFMMGRPEDGRGGGERPRGTLQIPQMIKEYNLSGAIAINNAGNAFTPQCSVNPLELATFGVAMYQAATTRDLQLLLECVSSRAKHAIGLGSSPHLEIQVGGPADLVCLGSSNGVEKTSSVIASHVLGSSRCSVSPSTYHGSVVTKPQSPKRGWSIS